MQTAAGGCPGKEAGLIFLSLEWEKQGEASNRQLETGKH